MNLCKSIQIYLEYCQFRKRLDGKTLKAYRIDLAQYQLFIGAQDVSKEMIEKYLATLHQKYKPKTVKRKIASIKAFYNFLEDEAVLSENPFRCIKVKFKENMRLPRIIPRAEIERLFNFVYSIQEKNSKWQLRDIAVIEIFFATGARVYEISNLRADCIDLSSGTLKILGKGGKERYIQVGTSDVIEVLKKYYAKFQQEIDESGYFFINQRGSRFSEQSIRNMLRKYTLLAGIDRNITPHMFRHSFATYLIEEGVDVSCVQQILGHSSIKTTQIYIHIAAKKQAEILRVYHPRNTMKIHGIA